MQWSREGVHQVLQIWAMMASWEWESPWPETFLSALGALTSLSLQKFDL